MKDKIDKMYYGVNIRYAQQAVDQTAKRVIADVSGMSVCSVSVLQNAGTWATGILTVKQSNNRDGPWTALSGVSTLTAATPSTGQFSVGYNFIMVDVTTGEGSDSFVTISISGKE